MQPGFFPDDLAALKRATQKTAEELYANKRLTNAYWRWLSTYHAASGVSGPLGPQLITALLGHVNAFKSPAELAEAEAPKTDWTRVKPGERVQVTIEPRDGNPGRTCIGVFGAAMGDGQLVVRLQNETNARLVPERVVKLASAYPNGVDATNIGKPSASVTEEAEPPAIKEIERRAALAREQEAARKRLDEAQYPELDVDFDDDPPEAAEATDAEREELAGPAPAIPPRTASPAPQATVTPDAADAPSAEAKVRETPWLWAEPNTAAIVEYEGDWVDATFANVVGTQDPDDYKLEFWCDDLGKSLIVSEHKARSVDPLPTAAEATHAAVSEL